jgi:hypothetical protein
MAIDLSTYGGSVFPIGLVGEIADNGPRRVKSYVNQGATAIDFGIAVKLGAATTILDGNCAIVSASADLLLGITIRDPNRVKNSSGFLAYAQNDVVPVMVLGRVFVIALDTVRRNDQVIVPTASGGSLSSSAAGVVSGSRLLLPNAVWDTDTTAGAVGVVHLFGSQTARSTT